MPELLTTVWPVACWLALAVLGFSMPAMADQWTEDAYPVKQVSYSTGQSGHKLTWLPSRPAKPQASDGVMAAQHVGTLPPAVRLPTSQLEPQRPIANPFGDKSAPKTLDEIGTQPPVGLSGQDNLLPDFPAGDSLPEEPAATQQAAPEAAAAQPTQAADAAPEQLFQLPETSSRRVPTIVEALAGGQGVVNGQCPTPEEILKPIGKLTTDIAPQGDKFPANCPLGEKMFEARDWAPTTFTWKASGLCHKPLYFEDVQLERYGHSWGPYLQPIISGGHFFLTIPALPYMVGLCPPQECEYTLGYYRPGSCAPYMLDPLPLSIRAGLAAGGIWTGMVFLIP